MTMQCQGWDPGVVLETQMSCAFVGTVLRGRSEVNMSCELDLV